MTAALTRLFSFSLSKLPIFPSFGLGSSLCENCEILLDEQDDDKTHMKMRQKRKQT